MSKHGVIYGLYFPVFGLNTGKYRPEITPYLHTFHAVSNYKGFMLTRKVGNNPCIRSVTIERAGKTT